MKLSKRHKAAAVAGGLTAAEAVVVTRRRGSLFRARTIVRCRRGHLFTTIWIPGGSLKAVRLGPWRLQRCPVGKHWSLVTPVNMAKLSEEDREFALSRRDTRLP
jgi:hypothetical protein